MAHWGRDGDLAANFHLYTSELGPLLALAGQGGKLNVQLGTTLPRLSLSDAASKGEVDLLLPSAGPFGVEQPGLELSDTTGRTRLAIGSTTLTEPAQGGRVITPKSVDHGLRREWPSCRPMAATIGSLDVQHRAGANAEEESVRAFWGFGLAVFIMGCTRTALLYPANNSAAQIGILKATYVASGTGHSEVEIKMPDGEILKGAVSIVRGGTIGFGTFLRRFMVREGHNRQRCQHDCFNSRRKSGNCRRVWKSRHLR